MTGMPRSIASSTSHSWLARQVRHPRGRCRMNPGTYRRQSTIESACENQILASGLVLGQRLPCSAFRVSYVAMRLFAVRCYSGGGVLPFISLEDCLFGSQNVTTGDGLGPGSVALL